MPVYGPTTVVSSAARTTTSQSSSITLKNDTQTVVFLMNTSAVSGDTPTLDFAVQWSNDGTNWGGADTPDTFAQVTATKVSGKPFTRKGTFCRLTWVVAGSTPSFTFDVSMIEMT